jgi:hypothetical protein
VTCRAARHTDNIVFDPEGIDDVPYPFRGCCTHRVSPSKKRDALSAVRTPDETTWSFRASDIYQGGENEPSKLTEICPAAIKPLDSEFEKIYHVVEALNVCAHLKKQIPT